MVGLEGFDLGRGKEDDDEDDEDDEDDSGLG